MENNPKKEIRVFVPRAKGSHPEKRNYWRDDCCPKYPTCVNAAAIKDTHINCKVCPDRGDKSEYPDGFSFFGNFERNSVYVSRGRGKFIPQ